MILLLSTNYPPPTNKCFCIYPKPDIPLCDRAPLLSKAIKNTLVSHTLNAPPKVVPVGTDEHGVADREVGKFLETDCLFWSFYGIC